MTLEMETRVNANAASPSPLEVMMPLMFGKQITYSLSALARLGVADHMNGVPVGVEELAEKVNAHSPSLYRVMRMLASVGVFQETSGKQFTLTPAGELLKTDVPGSLRYLAIMWGDEWSTRAFAYLTDCVRTGGDGVTKAYGKSAFELFNELPEQAENFHRAMTGFSGTEAAALLETYDFTGIRRLADVGGGHGKLLASILNRYPQIEGVLFDLPETIAGAPGNNHFAGCETRIKVEWGSFFDRVPAGCDAYILKHIIHDWSDEHCRKILSLIREQLPSDGRVLLCEMVVPDDPGPAPAKMLDIEMLALTIGGKERTAGEFSDLFASAGLRLTQILRTKAPMCVIEARKA
jgi:hypothetical protein